MKKALLCVAALGLLSFSAFAQRQFTKEMHHERIRELIKEKVRTSSATTGTGEENSALKTTAFDKRVSNSGVSTNEAETFIAIHPADTSKLVLSYMEHGNGLRFPIYYSSDGGNSWQKSSFSSVSVIAQDFPGHSIIGGGDPVFAWDKNGRLYFSWIYFTLDINAQDTAFFTLYYAYSDNNGSTWTVPPAPDRFVGRGAIDLQLGETLDWNDGVCDRQWMAVDNSGGPNQGNLYCSFAYLPALVKANQTGTALKVKTPGSTSFGPLVNVFTNANSQFANVEVDNNGAVHVVFTDILNDEIKHASSTNGGASFGTTHLVSTVDNPFSGTNRVHNRENAATNLAIDGAGNLHLVWTSFPSSNGVESFHSYSTDGGLVWSTPRNINTLLNVQRTLMPTVSADGNNVTITVAGMDNTNVSQVYQANSSDYGQNFAAPLVISASTTDFNSFGQNSFFGDYNRSVRKGCYDYSTWGDGRNGQSSKVYFAAVNHCTLGIKEITTVNSSLQLKSMYPNPAKDVVNLNIAATKNGEADITISDISGKQIYSQHVVFGKGSKTLQIPVANIAAGSYMLSIISDDGIVTKHLQMVK